MVAVYVKEELKLYEADIRDLCLAFFPYQKVKFIDSEFSEETDNDFQKNIIIKDFFRGNLTNDRAYNKSEIKRQLYSYLSEKTKKNLLWGTLTGIRPVTIVTNYIEDKYKNDFKSNDNFIEEVIKEYLIKEYYISDEKANKLINIAENEIEILNRNDIKNYKERYSIYIGVPFCKSTCLYCSFTSFNIEKFGNYVDKYLEALDVEFQKFILDKKLENNIINKDGKLIPLTIYIGGGTPTSLNEEQFERFIKIIDKYVDINSAIELTVEAGRPDTITKAKLECMKKYNVSRISINPQTFNDKTLKLIGRKHSVSDTIEKYKLARELGFDNINMDIILGLPNEKIFDVLNTLINIYKLKPDSLTVHSLALKRAARFNLELENWVNNYYLSGLKDSEKTEGRRTIDIMSKMCEIAAKSISFNPYYLYRQKNMAGNLENVGYAKYGKECIYNIMMMSERHTVFGFGLATTKEVFYEENGKRIESKEGYKSVIDYCKTQGI